MNKIRPRLVVILMLTLALFALTIPAASTANAAAAACTSANLTPISRGLQSLGNSQYYAWGRVRPYNPGPCIGRTIYIYLAEERRGGGYSYTGRNGEVVDGQSGDYTSLKIYVNCRTYDKTRYTGRMGSMWRFAGSSVYRVGGVVATC